MTMKKKPTIIIAAIALIAVLCGCEPMPKTVKQFHGGKRIYIDTLEIHGRLHEVLFWSNNKTGGMIHSPECWCGTKTDEQ